MSQTTKPVLRHPRYHLPEGCPRNWFSNLYEKTLQDHYSISIIVVGKRTGISKTYSTLRLAELFDVKGFGAKDVEDGRYCFYAQTYIDVVKNTEPYRWIIFDEPGRMGSGGSKQEWQSNVNKALASTAQVSRKQLPISAFVVPHRAYVATQIFGLAQLLLVFEDRGYGKLYGIEVSEFDGNIYTPFKCVIRTSMPSSDLIEAAEAAKQEMWERDTSKWSSEIKRKEKVQQNPDDIAEQIIREEDISNFYADRRGEKVLDATLISQFALCSPAKGYQIRNSLILKGADKIKPNNK